MTHTKPKIALMSYAMDNRKAKGIALYTRKLIEGLVSSPEFDFYLVHYEKVSDPVYGKAKEIIMPRISLPFGSRFVSQMLFYWKYRKNPFDVVHWFHPRVYPFFWLMPAKKIIVTVHGAGDIAAPTNFIFSRSVFNFVLKHFHKHINKIIVDSKYAKEEVIKYYGFPSNKIETIYLGGGEVYKPILKSEAKELVANKYKISGDYILDVSRLQPHKNVKALIEAYILIRNKYSKRNEKLVIVGGVGDKKVEEYAMAERSIFSEDIIFINFVDYADLNSVYSASELFVFPSLNEGFGLPVLEAMASGVPVITSNVTSMPEIGDKAVITVNPSNIVDIAEAMEKVLSDSALQEKMIKLGLERSKDFTWESTISQTKNLYRTNR